MISGQRNRTLRNVVNYIYPSLRNMDAVLIQEKIHQVRARFVMTDFVLAEMYGVSTKSLNQAVRRNLERFPSDFMFQLTKTEWARLSVTPSSGNWSQIVTSYQKHRRRQFRPLVFTEQGVAMLSSVLRSKKAVRVNIAIMRAFVLIRQFRDQYKALDAEIKRLEKEMNIRFVNIYEALEFLTARKKSMAEIGFKQRGRS